MVNQNQENKLENSEPSYEYDERATQMLAEDVMAGDLVRGLIELITNSDDGYNRLEEKGKPVKNATILVNVDRSSKNRLAVVKDKADGFGKNKKEAREKLRWYGRRLSGRAEGGKQRGNFGFGLKDIIGLGNHKIESIRLCELGVNSPSKPLREFCRKFDTLFNYTTHFAGKDHD